MLDRIREAMISCLALLSTLRFFNCALVSLICTCPLQCHKTRIISDSNVTIQYNNSYLYTPYMIICFKIYEIVLLNPQTSIKSSKMNVVQIVFYVN